MLKCTTKIQLAPGPGRMHKHGLMMVIINGCMEVLVILAIAAKQVRLICFVTIYNFIDDFIDVSYLIIAQLFIVICGL
jgi:hypothetical protein